MSNHIEETRQIWEMQAIREALGVGHKPMLSDLPGIVAERMQMLRLIRGEMEHWHDLLSHYADHANSVVAIGLVRNRIKDMVCRINEVAK